MAKSFGRNAFTVGGLTAVSRVLGLVRDMVTAWILGASGLADVFFVAMRLPNLLRCFIAEGAVSVAFVPVFNEVKENEGLAKALQMSQAVLSLLTIILAVTVAVGEIFAPALVMLIAPGFLHNPAFETAVHLTRIMFPFIMLVSILALFMGILNSLNHFVAPAAAPIVLNVFMIATPLVLHVWYPFFASPADALAWGVIVGGVVQLLIQFPALKRYKVPLGFSRDFKDPHIRKMARLVGISSIGASAYQIQVFVSTMLASMLAVGSVSYLVYAGRIMELPLGLFVYAVSNVMLPSMSSAFARGDMDEFSTLVYKSLSTVLMFTIPATIALLMLAEPIMVMLFERGAFTRADAIKAALALQMYGVSLWAVGYARIQTQALYAMQKATIVIRIVWVGLCVFVASALILMHPMSHPGIALALSISTLVQMLIQATFLHRHGVRVGRRLAKDAAKMLGASCLMGAVIYPFLRLNFWNHGLHMTSALILLALIGLCGGVYFGLLWLVGIRFKRA